MKQIILSNRKTLKIKTFINKINKSLYKKQNKNYFDNNIYYSILEEMGPYEKYILKNTKRILEIGCATGDHIYEIKKKYPDIECIGIDISKKNIELAKNKSIDGLHYYNIDYKDINMKPVDLIIANSVMGFLSIEDELLYKKLYNDLKIGGRLVFSIHKKCMYNYILNKLSSFLRLFSKHFIVNTLLIIKRYLYPNIDRETLLQRIKYIYVPIYRTMNNKMKSNLEKNNFHIISSKKLAQSSTSSYKYLIVVCDKISN